MQPPYSTATEVRRFYTGFYMTFSKLREYKYHNKPNMIVVPVLALVLCDERVGLSGKVFYLYSMGPGFEPHWILLVFRGSVFGQDLSETQPSTYETQERHEKCRLSPLYD